MIRGKPTYGMHPKEKLIREQRLIAATKNNFMGEAGKLGTIVRFLGQPIISQGGGMYEATYLKDIFRDEPALPEIDVNTETHVLGWGFDGLSRGIHLEIQHRFDERKITVWYKGYQVYCEIAGELDSYAPFPEWETIIERLYLQAKKKQKTHKDDMAEQAKVDKAMETASWLKRMRMMWGI